LWYLLQFVFHYLARDTDTFTALRTYRNKISELLKRLGLIATNCLTDCFITNAIT
jgi:hypothetical protein